MSDFQLDTSGEVRIPAPVSWAPLAKSVILWDRDLSPFEQGYVEAMFRAAETELLTQAFERKARAHGGRCVPPAGPGFSDLAPETLARIRKDCAAASHAGSPLASMQERGAALWTLREANLLKSHPPLALYLSDDGKVRLK